MTKTEFANKWGYQGGIGMGSAQFDCRAKLLADLDRVLRAELIPLMACPICLGEGKLTTKGNATSVFEPCHYCHGAKVIHMYLESEEK